jgi:hypothetical protein
MSSSGCVKSRTGRISEVSDEEEPDVSKNSVRTILCEMNHLHFSNSCWFVSCFSTLVSNLNVRMTRVGPTARKVFIIPSENALVCVKSFWQRRGANEKNDITASRVQQLTCKTVGSAFPRGEMNLFPMLVLKVILC